MQPDDLISLKDDMVAFIEGHAMRRLPGFITEDLPTVLWEDDDNPDSWKDFVEMAKTASAPFVTMSEVKLEKEDIAMLLEQIRDDNFPDEAAAEVHEAQYLVNYVGKIGYIQLGFATRGSCSCTRTPPRGTSATSNCWSLSKTSETWFSKTMRMKKKGECCRPRCSKPPDGAPQPLGSASG